MPLTQQETFKAKLQRHNRLTVPQLLRWRYKMESSELIKVNVKPLNSECYSQEEFFAKLATDGRLTIPKLTIQILEQAEHKRLEGAIFEVIITPTTFESAETKTQESPEEKLET